MISTQGELVDVLVAVDDLLQVLDRAVEPVELVLELIHRSAPSIEAPRR
jgi:hypothetical protein